VKSERRRLALAETLLGKALKTFAAFFQPESAVVFLMRQMRNGIMLILGGKLEEWHASQCRLGFQAVVMAAPRLHLRLGGRGAPFRAAEMAAMRFRSPDSGARAAGVRSNEKLGSCAGCLSSRSHDNRAPIARARHIWNSFPLPRCNICPDALFRNDPMTRNIFSGRGA